MASNPVTRLTEEQYLEIERAAEYKSEFLNGEMFAMSGVSMRHALLHKNLLGELYNRLRGTACEAVGPDLKVRVSSSGMYTYPDIVVVCGKPILADDHHDVLLNPIVIIEVLSPSTRGYDSGLKFQHYRTIESLRDYILVDQDMVWIGHFTRHADDTWTLRDHRRIDEELKLDSIGASIPLAAVYDRVDLSAA